MLFRSKFTNSRFEPAGMTDDPDIRMAQSMMDYIFRRLALDYLPSDFRSAYGIFTSAERASNLDSGDYAKAQPIEADSVSVKVEPESKKAESKPVEIKIEAAPINVGSSTELLEKISGVKSDAPLCVTCGVKMRASGACYVCEGCGSTSGCS